jgi:hypothetical protein
MWIPDPFRGDPSRLHQPRFAAHPEFDGWIAKLKETALNEIAAYQLARHLGLGVLDSRWFVAERNLEAPGIRLDRGDAGMLLVKVTDADGINLQELARHDPLTVARICAFFVLDRGEWPEPWSVAGQLRLIDLEFILARFVSRAADRRWRLDEYAEMTPVALAHAGREAARCGVEPVFHQELAAWHRRFAGDGFAFDFSGHRRGPLISEFLLRSLRLRLGLVAEILDFPQLSA